MIAVQNLDDLDADYIAVHTGYDLQAEGQSPLESLRKVKSVISNSKVAVAGAVGIFGIQLAKAKGAYVATTASTHNHEFLKSIGADVTIDYNTERFEDYVHDYDIVLDTQAGETLERSYDVLKPGVRLISIRGQVNKKKAESKGITAYFTWTELNRQDLIEVVNLYGYGVVKAYFEAIFPLSFVREAHKLSENGHSRGKIVINNKS